MTVDKPKEKERRHPRNPWFGLYFALLLLLPAVLGAVALLELFPRVVAHDMKGQRSEGFVLFTPFLLAFFGVITAVRAIRAFRPWYAYRALTARARRQVDMALDLLGQVRWPMAVFGGVAFLGWIALLLLQPLNVGGKFLLWELQLMVLLLWSAMFGLLAQTLYFARFRPAPQQESSSEGQMTPGDAARDSL